MYATSHRKCINQTFMVGCFLPQNLTDLFYFLNIDHHDLYTRTGESIEEGQSSNKKKVLVVRGEAPYDN